MTQNVYISFVIPSYNSSDKLINCISSIKNSASHAVDFEIIVADSSDDDTRELLEKEHGDVKVVILPTRTPPGLARNAGSKNANGSALAFIDSDCAVSADYYGTLKEALEKHEAGGGSILNGTPKSQVGTAEYYLEFSSFLPEGSERTVDFCPTCNFFVKKDIFNEIGGFSGARTAEDMEFGIALKKNGRSVAFVPKLQVTHYNRTDMAHFLNNQFLLGRGSAIIRKKYGDLKGSVFTKYPFLIPLLLFQTRMQRVNVRMGFFASLNPEMVSAIKKGVRSWTDGFEEGARFPIENEPAGFGNEKVSVCIINYNGANFLERCLLSIFNQTYKNLEIIVVDNASTDESRQMLAGLQGKVKVILNQENAGFCNAVNKGIASSSGEYFLSINTDVFLEPYFVANALKGFWIGEKVGVVCGKLLRYDADKDAPTNVIDSTGIMMSATFRAFDRGSGTKDRLQYKKIGYVFGACGAAALYKRDFLENVKHGSGEYFDEIFFAYKEDVDIAWRGRKKGWRTIYMPDAIAYHVRNFQSQKRKKMPEIIRFHSFKNRYVMLLKNLTPLDFIVHCIPLFFFELSAFVYVLLFDQKLFKAYSYVLKNLKAILKKR